MGCAERGARKGAQPASRAPERDQRRARAARRDAPVQGRARTGHHAPRGGDFRGAHRRAMRAARPGRFEYEIEAELLHEFRRHGAQFPAYRRSSPAAPTPACCITSATTRALHDGDLLLIDAGCELDGYASDITRTFPVNGTFSARAARRLRNRARRAGGGDRQGARRATPGTTRTTRRCACWRRAFIDLKLLPGSVDDVLENGDLQALLHAPHRPLAGHGRARRRRLQARRASGARCSPAWC